MRLLGTACLFLLAGIAAADTTVLQAGEALRPEAREGNTKVYKVTAPFVLRVQHRASGAPAAIQVCAGVERGILVGVKQGVATSQVPCYAPGTGMATSRRGEDPRGLRLFLSSGEGHNYYDASRRIDGAGYSDIHVSGVRGLSGETIWEGVVYVAIFLDDNRNRMFDEGEYEFLELALVPPSAQTLPEPELREVEVSVASQGKITNFRVTDAELKKHAHTFLAMRAVPEAESPTVVRWIAANADALPPAFFYEAARRLWLLNRAQSLEWYALAATRARYDALRCRDPAAQQEAAMLAQLAPEVARGLAQHSAAFGAAGLHVLERPDLFSSRVSAWWICSQGLGVMHLAAQGKPVREANWARPQAEWPGIRERVREQATAYFRQQGYPSPESPLAALMRRGRHVYEVNCAACHHSSGAGVRGAFPPLASARVLDDKPALIRATLFPRPNTAMASHCHLHAEEVAAVLTYVRNAWTETPRGPVQPEDVLHVIAATPERSCATASKPPSTQAR